MCVPPCGSRRHPLTLTDYCVPLLSLLLSPHLHLCSSSLSLIFHCAGFPRTLCFPPSLLAALQHPSVPHACSPPPFLQPMSPPVRVAGQAASLAVAAAGAEGAT
ncbi:hypothetical protein ATANTOWER_011830 [Ataeniobius toweri]|uniref:Uncharacterized protein n=1 Tax=Ataeniobius toweri TaxID=208326 RepID=A0ABU7BPU4_9TELE|nr:hypothetical protein [Ataeniobius toweri]